MLKYYIYYYNYFVIYKGFYYTNYSKYRMRVVDLLNDDIPLKQEIFFNPGLLNP